MRSLVYEEQQLVPLYSSPHRNRIHTIHLLLLTDGDSYHYTLIRDIGRLVTGRTKHNGRTHVCPYCLHPFTQQHVLDNHIFNCSIHKPQAVSFPKEADASLYYKSVNKEYPVPYVLYVDFETFLMPSADKDVVSEHVPSGFCCLKVSNVDNEIFPPYIYSGEDVMSKFYDHIFKEQQTICRKLNKQIPMSPLTRQQKN